MDEIQVSVVYADELGQVFQQDLRVASHCTVGSAIQQSSFLQKFPLFKLERLSVGVYSVRKNLDDLLHDQDRIEIYRNLLIDPKDRRRQMVDQKRSAKKWRRALPIKQKVRD